MGEARHDCIRFARGEFHQPSLQACELPRDEIAGRAQVEADIRCDLVVAGPPRVQLLARVADQGGQPGLDIHVHILEFHGPLKFAGRDFRADAGHAVADGGELIGVEYADVPEHASVCQ